MNNMSAATTGRKPAKRISIVRIQMVKEKSLLYPARHVRMPKDVADLFRTFLSPPGYN